MQTEKLDIDSPLGRKWLESYLIDKHQLSGKYSINYVNCSACYDMLYDDWVFSYQLYDEYRDVLIQGTVTQGDLVDHDCHID